MKPEQIHAEITAKRADELARLRFENRILKRLVELGEQGCWPVRSDDPIPARKKNLNPQN